MIINRYPIWKYCLILFVLAVGGLYAVPNIYGEDPAVQVSVNREDLQAELENQVQQLLANANIEAKAIEASDDEVLVRLNSLEQQAQTVEVLQDALDTDYTVALNLAPATPQWLRDLSALPMYLGLDLRGGVHFLLQVDMDTAIRQMLESMDDGMRRAMREDQIRYGAVKIGQDSIRVAFKDAENRDKAFDKLRDDFSDLSFDVEDEGGQFYLFGELRETVLVEERQNALTQNITTLRNRVNALGVAEPVIQRQGDDRIVVQLPGVQDTAEAKNILQATATLEYRLVHGTNSDWINADQTGRVPVGSRLYYDRQGQPVLLKRSVIVKGDNVVGAAAGFDQQNNLPAVIVTLDSKGAKRMSDISGENIGQPMAVIFIETKIDYKKVDGELKSFPRKVEEVISIATIRDQLSKRFQTTGLTAKEAKDLSLLLRSGSLRAPMTIIEERTVGPSLGQDNIDKGYKSILVGLSLVMIFMIIYYQVFGLIANLALAANIMMIVAVLSMLQATLTMPGIAGILLTVGMAVDANVLIFERIREELANGNSIQASIHAGYAKAFSTIFDANITTFIAAAILFVYGTGPVKGFAVTLSIGIATSMFTAIMGTRAVVNLVYGGRRVNKLAI